MVTQKKKLERIKKLEIEESEETCPKCSKKMERRRHKEAPETETYYFKEWDYCPSCNFLQHYEQFKVVDRKPKPNLFSCG